MKIKTKKINYHKFSEKIYSLTIFIVIIIVSLFLSFLYSNVYLVMIQAEKVSDLKTKTVADKINQEKMLIVLEKIEEKENIISDNKKINNPFVLKTKVIEVKEEKTPETAVSDDLNIDLIEEE